MDVPYNKREKPCNYETLATCVIRAKSKRLKVNLEYQTFSVDNIQVLQMIRVLLRLQELFIKCLWADNIPDSLINLSVYRNTLKKLVGVFAFDSDGKGQTVSTVHSNASGNP